MRAWSSTRSWTSPMPPVPRSRGGVRTPPSTASRWWRCSASPTGSASSPPPTCWSGSGTRACSGTGYWRRPSRLCGEPAVDDEDMAGDEPRLLGGEEQDGGGDVLGLAETPERRATADLRELLVVEANAHLRAQVAGRHRVHRDLAGAELARERAREAVEGCLRRAVDGQAAVARHPGDGGDVDDPAGTAGEHAANDGARHLDGRSDVQVEHRLDVVVA